MHSYNIFTIIHLTKYIFFITLICRGVVTFQRVKNRLADNQNGNNASLPSENIDLSERLAQLESLYESDIRKFHDSFDDIIDSFDKLKEQMRIFVESKVDSEISPLKARSEDITKRMAEFEEALTHLSDNTSEDTVRELREELLEGIRLLGKRVSKAIQDMESRFEELSERIESSAAEADAAGKDDAKEFGSVKESTLLNPENLDVISSEALDRLAQLFRKQSLGIKKFNEDQLFRINEFEQLIKTYDEENTKIIEGINRKIRKNFFILVFGFCLLIIILKVLQLI